MLLCGSIGSEQLRTLAKVGATSGCARWGYMVPTPSCCWRSGENLEGSYAGCSAGMLCREKLSYLRLGGVAGYRFPAEVRRVLGCRCGNCLFQGGKTSSPPPEPLISLSLSCFPPHNDADCSTSVIITLCLKIQNKSQERNWCGLSRILLPRGSGGGGWVVGKRHNQPWKMEEPGC